jgi:hypothetical protein
MDPFKVAERYLQLKKLCAPRSVGDQMIQINEMILAPLISLTFLCLQSLDLVSALTSALSVYRAWSRWIEYSSLRFEMQRMYLQTMAHGGPQIVTNDPEYLPYVYADAVVRAGMRRQGPGVVLRRLGPWSHIQSSPPVHATPAP